VISFAFTSGALGAGEQLAASRPDAAKAFMPLRVVHFLRLAPHVVERRVDVFLDTPSNCAATATRIRLRVLTGKNGFHRIGLYRVAPDEPFGLHRVKLALFLTPASVSAGDLLLVALKMPPSRIGTYSNFTPMRFSISGIAS